MATSESADGEGSEATVWIAPQSRGRRAKCYHTDSDCSHVDPDRYRRVSRERAVERYDLDICSRCEGTVENAGVGCSDHYRALVAAAEANAERDDGEGED